MRNLPSGLGSIPTTWSACTYYENAHAQDRPTEPTTVPLGFAGFGGDFSGIRRFAERDHANILSWNMYPSGGHFAAHERMARLKAKHGNGNKAPNEPVGDMRVFYRGLR